jgi:ADP-ribose pyrophosphatase YjhB (NUDIX family)
MKMNYIFCPQCKTELIPKTESYYCPNCKETIYLNSKPTSSVLIMDGDKVLLGIRAHNPGKGKYDIIGGFLNLGEHPEVGAIREAKEETGLNIKITGLLGVYMDKYVTTGEDTLNFVYLGKVVSGKEKAGDDIASLEWVDIDELPGDPAFISQKQIFKDLQKLHKS